MMTPAEAIIESDIFSEFTKGAAAKEKKVLNIYDSKIVKSKRITLEKLSSTSQ